SSAKPRASSPRPPSSVSDGSGSVRQLSLDDKGIPVVQLQNPQEACSTTASAVATTSS
ncbi:unnamed protein product, partial [Amoebophrya sp. A25]